MIARAALTADSHEIFNPIYRSFGTTKSATWFLFSWRMAMHIVKQTYILVDNDLLFLSLFRSAAAFFPDFRCDWPRSRFYILSSKFGILNQWPMGMRQKTKLNIFRCCQAPAVFNHSDFDERIFWVFFSSLLRLSSRSFHERYLLLISLFRSLFLFFRWIYFAEVSCFRQKFLVIYTLVCVCASSPSRRCSKIWINSSCAICTHWSWTHGPRVHTIASQTRFSAVSFLRNSFDLFFRDAFQIEKKFRAQNVPCLRIRIAIVLGLWRAVIARLSHERWKEFNVGENAAVIAKFACA